MSWKERIHASAARWGLIALCAFLVLAWLRYAPPESPWSPHRIIGMVMPEPRVIVKIEKQIVPGPERIKIVPKEKIITIYKDLPTPATVSDPTAVVTAVAAIPASPEGGVALAVLTTVDNVGVGTIEYRPATPKFFQIKRAFSAEGWYFPAGNRLAEAAIVANPLRIGPIEVKAKIGADMERETSTLRGFAGVGFEVKF